MTGPQAARSRRLGRIPEWNAAILAAILAVSWAVFPVADSIFPEQLTRCGWAGWIGLPSIICPDDMAGGMAIEIVMNLPVSVLNLCLAVAYVAAVPETWSSAWRMFLIPQLAAAVLPTILVIVLLKRLIVAISLPFFRWVRK